MKILSIRKGFQADHSSTSYEFFAIDRPLNHVQQKEVSSLSSRARPTRRRVSFIYHGDFNDLPGGWRPLVKKYYDVMYSESYGWWTLAMAFETDQNTIDKIKKYEFSGIDDMGVYVDSQKNRVVVSIHCHINPGFDFKSSYSDYDYCEEDDEEEGEFEEAIESEDSLLNLLSENREYLKKGDCRLLYGVWQKYGLESRKSKKFEGKVPPPEPPEMDKLPQPIKSLISLLER